MADENIEGLAELQARLDAVGNTHWFLGTLGLRAVAQAKALVPRKTGNLGRTIRLGTVTDDSAEILAGGISNVGYAADVEFGTKPHLIVPRRKQALRFVSNASYGPTGNARLTGAPRAGASGVVFAKSVRHPGTQPHPFMMPAAQWACDTWGVPLIIRAWNNPNVTNVVV